MMKPVQVSKYEVYLIGGTNEAVNEMYAECLCYNLSTRLVTQAPTMNSPRMSFGLMYFDQYIYVVGGAGENRKLLPS